MKVLYNTCYGGFSFSLGFVDALFLRYPPDTEEGSGIFEETKGYVVTLEEYAGTTETSVVLKYEPMGTYQKAYYTHCYKTLAPDDIEVNEQYYMYYANGKYYSRYLFTNLRFTNLRSNQTVANFAVEYGLAKASGDFSDLDVTEVPDGFSWRVSEYDGMENIIASPPFKDICIDLVNYVRGKEAPYKCQFSKDIIDGKVSLEDLLKRLE